MDDFYHGQSTTAGAVPVTKKGEVTKLKRKLKSRHLTMISLGGSIGTGLFLASGGAIHSAGPGGALLAYALIGVMVYFLMTSLAEMAAYMPVAGTFSTYATKFVDPALGFALGWNYWYNWAITIAAELSAATIIMKFWFPHTPSIVWSAACLLIMFLLNYLSVKGFGEAEYWFAIIKVVTVIAFIIVGALMIFGIMGGKAIGFHNLTIADGPVHGGFLAVLGIFMAAGFSFQGTELLGVAAGESEDPEKTIPHAVKSVFWRILLFYILAIFVIGLLIPFTDSRLTADDITMSPFTIVFQRAGIAFAASVMNAIILTAVLSAGNSGMYASTRMLWELARDGKAPKFLGKLNKRGVPVNALIVTALVGTVAFLASFFGDGAVYNWLLNASGLSGFIAWLGIAISHYRFRRAYVAQGKALSDLPYRSRWFPFGPLFAFAVCTVVILGQNYQAFLGDHIKWESVFVSYIGLPIFIAVWLIYKFVKKTKVVSLQECDFNRES
ncbi:amino acid permease [Weizmannia coagulans]|jgi:lysine-specific permease|uniref:Gamma-aminobutyrate permease n=2 Tax=Heyndrickxia TaxID=2837504 RepID=A0AAN0T9Q7_HEYCO|nr:MULTISPECIES: amino acid permease [Heyndrickxia]AJO24564.1 gamma-aminobutyrate permease [Heyndrickxia coagulans]AKN53985.1 Lysine-specific permease [Heyndrickxia coagulans]ATW84351.1 amino acid permease [Heyndrickxia coagulans]AVD54986.1 amino acid permease [Heyndrickxia coagulans]KGB30311.1 gamma-aminobutyrate permease [Heyndrickxia coagulans]